MVTALHGRGRLDNSMCTANLKGGCKADTCDYVKRWAGWMGSRRDHTACCTQSQSTRFGETKQKGDVQNVHDRVSMLRQYSHRAHRAGHAAGRGSGKPPAGMSRGYAVNALPRLPHGLNLNTLILWRSHRQGLRLILLLTPNNDISQKETHPDLHQGKPLRCTCTAFWVGRCCPSPWGGRERWEGPHGGTAAPLVRDCTTF